MAVLFAFESAKNRRFERGIVARCSRLWLEIASLTYVECKLGRAIPTQCCSDCSESMSSLYLLSTNAGVEGFAEVQQTIVDYF